MSVWRETRWPVNTFNTLALLSFRSKKPTLVADQLLEKAMKKTGLNDFGDEIFLEGFRILIDAIEREGKLHAFGRGYAQQVLLHILSNRLQLQARWTEYPESLQEKIDRPVIIAAPPRTGTTLLFNLLSLDNSFRWLESWQATNPGADVSNEKSLKETMLKAEKNIQLINYLRPDFKAMHKLGVKAPEECVPLLSNSFENDFFIFAYPIPSYQNWYINRDRSYTYSYYKKQLQWLQFGKTKKRWLLKTPSHLSSLAALFTEFPDATVLQTHRDPLEFTPSWGKMRYAFRAIGSYQVNEANVGRYVSELLVEALKKLMELRNEKPLNIADIKYVDLVNDPLNTMRGVYQSIGEDFTPDKEQRITQYLQENPRHKDGENKYSLSDYRLDEQEIRARFKFYVDHFGLAS